MKLFSLFVLLSSVKAFAAVPACPELSGVYGCDGKQTVITQEEKSGVTTYVFESHDEVVAMITDGKPMSFDTGSIKGTQKAVCAKKVLKFTRTGTYTAGQKYNLAQNFFINKQGKLEMKGTVIIKHNNGFVQKNAISDLCEKSGN